MKSRVLLLFLLFATSARLAFSCARSWNLSELEPILVPLYISTPAPGAAGSLWKTDLVIHSGDFPLFNDPCGIFWPLMGKTIPPETTFTPTLNPEFRNPGRLMYLHRLTPARSRPSFGLRVRDLARQASSAGTEIPLVREKHFRQDTIYLLSVPVEARFRVALRAYDPDATGQVLLRVRVFSAAGSPPLYEQTLRLDPPTQNLLPEYNNYPAYPGYAQILNLETLVPAGIGSVRIELTTLTADSRFWAFASVTNNDTQHVTLITPQ